MKIIRTVTDDDGNIHNYYDNGKIELELPSEGRTRILGYSNSDILSVIRNYNHLHVKSNSYGFDRFLLTNPHLFGNFHTVSIFEKHTGKTYLVPLNEFIRIDKTQWYKNAMDGVEYERQFFMPLDELKKWDKATFASLSLFPI